MTIDLSDLMGLGSNLKFSNPKDISLGLFLPKIIRSSSRLGLLDSDLTYDHS